MRICMRESLAEQGVRLMRTGAEKPVALEPNGTQTEEVSLVHRSADGSRVTVVFAPLTHIFNSFQL